MNETLYCIEDERGNVIAKDLNMDNAMIFVRALFDTYFNNENEELKVQIEKMKCCCNCTHFKEYNDYPDIYYACELKECDNLDRWELVK